MKKSLLLVFVVLCLPLFAQVGQPDDAERNHATTTSPRFVAIDVFVDAGDQALAAYQVEVKAAAGAVKVVGIEGGDGIFKDAPYYDPEAMQGERVIVGALSTLSEAQLPRGKVRVARVHVMVEGNEPEAFAATLMAAGGPSGARIQGTAIVEQ